MCSAPWCIAILGHARCLGDRTKLETLALLNKQVKEQSSNVSSLDKVYFCLVTDRDQQHKIPEVDEPECYQLDGLQVQVDLLPCTEAESQGQPGHLTSEALNIAAKHAQTRYSPQCILLLDAGYSVGTDNWLSSLKEDFQQNPSVHCLALSTIDEPGLPVCVAIRGEHLETFNELLPSEVEGKDAGDYLFELYRRVGGSGSSKTIHVVENDNGTYRSSVESSAISQCTNAGASESLSLGIKQRTNNTVDAARYHIAKIVVSSNDPPAQPAPSKVWSGKGYLLPTVLSNQRTPSKYLQQLEAAANTLRARLQRHVLAVNVLIPSYRIEYDALHRIVTAPYNKDQADVKFVVQIDNPQQPSAVCAALTKLRHRMQHQVMIRKNPINLGASGARNGALDASAAELCIFFDDDVQPTCWCIDAYVDAFMKNPSAVAFAGPTFLPRLPKVMPVAIHMSGVTDFWEIPFWFGNMVPWAVTANVAYKNTTQRFDLRFPQTGGGEDVDFCVRLGAKAVAVPKAVAVHHWWPGNRMVLYRRFFKWFEGDGHLILLHPQLSYLVLPSAVMCMLVLLLCSALRFIGVRTAFLSCLLIWLVDLVAELLLQCGSASRRRRHPCPTSMRPHAALESCFIKTVAEFGRLYGHIKVNRYFSIFRKFDWYCGYNPSVIPFEQMVSGVKFLGYLASTVFAVWCAIS